MVQRRTYVDPGAPENDEVALDGLPNDPPDPLTTLHEPVPTVGVFAASVAWPQVDVVL